MRKNGRVKVIAQKAKTENKLNKSRLKGKKCLLPTPKLISISELCHYSRNYKNSNVKVTKNIEDKATLEYDLSKNLSPQTVQKSVRFAKLSLPEGNHRWNSLKKSKLIIQQKPGGRFHSILKRTNTQDSKVKQAENFITTVSSSNNFSQGSFLEKYYLSK